MTIETVEAAWDEVWDDDRIAAFTSKVLKYEHTDDSETEIADLSEGQSINFIEAITERQIENRLIGGGSTQVLQTYSVDVRYTVERDTQGDAYRNIVRFFEALSTVVDDILGSNWTNTVSYYEEQKDPIKIENADIAGTKCWRATYRFLARTIGTI